ncbi:hypothetical protein P691DRAFT_780145, partial [Macrolepiota fuliginosa MF-IS2]
MSRRAGHWVLQEETIQHGRSSRDIVTVTVVAFIKFVKPARDTRLTPVLVSMPFLVSFKGLVGRFSRDDGQREDSRSPVPSYSRAEANIDPAQCPPAPAPPAHVPSIIDNHHPENTGSTVPTTVVLVQQPPVGIHNTAASSAVPPE